MRCLNDLSLGKQMNSTLQYPIIIENFTFNLLFYYKNPILLYYLSINSSKTIETMR